MFLIIILIFFFFFKQKTAYEMRISDWSSDVCSSDLLRRQPDHRKHLGEHLLPAHGDAVHLYQAPLAPCRPRRCALLLGRIAAAAEVARALRRHPRGRQLGRASRRERVCPYVSISVVAVSLYKQTT